MNINTGYLLVFLAVIFYGTLTPLLKKAGEQIGPLSSMAISMLILFLSALLFSIFRENLFQIKLLENKTSVILLVAVGFINFAAFWLLLLGLKHMPIWQANLIFLLVPIFAGVSAYFILGEALSPKLFLALTIMAVGLYVGLR